MVSLKTVGIVGGATALTGIGALGLMKLSSSRKATKRRKTTRFRKRSKQRKPYTARKRRDTSTRRIRYTKNNQPYVILASGKARFIKKSSARSSKKRKGGRY